MAFSELDSLVPGWLQYKLWISEYGILDREQWPEDTPEVIREIFAKTTLGERMRWQYFDYHESLLPSFEKIRARTPEDLDRIRVEELRKKREILLGETREPADTPLTRAPLSPSLEAALNSLTLPERQVLEERWGLKDGREKFIPEIAMILGYPPEEVDKLLQPALRKLRRPIKITSEGESLEEAG